MKLRTVTNLYKSTSLWDKVFQQIIQDRINDVLGRPMVWVSFKLKYLMLLKY